MPPHAFEVELDGFRNQPPGFFKRGCGGDAPWQIRHISGPIMNRLFKNDSVSHLLSPACFNIEFSVPGGRSSPGWPGTVTVPDFPAWTYCRWSPRVRSRTQPSFSIRFDISRTFIQAPRSKRTALRVSVRRCDRVGRCARLLHLQKSDPAVARREVEDRAAGA